MSLSNFLIILTGVLLNAVAQLFLKAGTKTFSGLNISKDNIFLSLFNILFEIHIFSGLVCYVFSVAIWIVALSKVDVSLAYPMLSIGYVVNAILAYYLFSEVLTIQKIIGITIIIVGVYILAKS